MSGDNQDDGGMRMVYTLGGALGLILDQQKCSPLFQLDRRQRDGALVVPASSLLKNLLVRGEAVRVQWEGSEQSPEVQFRWNCPTHPDLPIGYQFASWDEQVEQDGHIFLYSDVVFTSSEKAFKTVLKASVPRQLPQCYTSDGGDVMVAVQPLFRQDVGNSIRTCAYLDQGRRLAVVVDLPKTTSEEVLNRVLIDKIAFDVFETDANKCALTIDPVSSNLLLKIDNSNSVRLHLTAERNMNRWRKQQQ